jgi:hypothetical protein
MAAAGLVAAVVAQLPAADGPDLRSIGVTLWLGQKPGGANLERKAA